MCSLNAVIKLSDNDYFYGERGLVSYLQGNYFFANAAIILEERGGAPR